MSPEFIFLKEDVFSFQSVKNKKLYGKKGDLVKIISISEPVLIVEANNGERFSVRREKTTAEKIEEIKIEKPEYKPMDLSDWEPEKIEIPKIKKEVVKKKVIEKPKQQKPQQTSLW